MRVVRAAVGALLVLVAAPLVLTGVGVRFAEGYTGPDGGFRAGTEQINSSGYAAVVPDIDQLLRADLPFARGGQTTLRLAAKGSGGPLFLGLAPYPAVERYLAGVTYSQIDRIRPARGAFPVDARVVPGMGAVPGPPISQTFWISSGTGLIRDGRAEDPLVWSPSTARGQNLALVIMRADGSSGLDIRLQAELKPEWLRPTMWGLLALGGSIALVGALILGWPTGRRDVVVVVEPGQLPEVAGRLGLRLAGVRAEVVPPAGGPTPGRHAAVKSTAGRPTTGKSTTERPGPGKSSAGASADGRRPTGDPADVKLGELEPADPAGSPPASWPPAGVNRPTSNPVPLTKTPAETVKESAGQRRVGVSSG